MKVFKETQRFNQWWLIILVVVVTAIFIYSFVKEYQDAGDNINNKQLISMVLSGGLLLVVFLLIFSLCLKTKMDENGISYQFSPIHLKSRIIEWSELSKCYVRKYSPISEYGGWGIRGVQRKGFWDFRKRGMAYNVKGDMGIQLIFKDKGKLLIGTQNPIKAEVVIKNYIHKIDNIKTLDNY